MSIDKPSNDSIMAVLRTELRDRPVRIVATLLFIVAAALLMPSAEVHVNGPNVPLPGSAVFAAVSSTNMSSINVQCLPPYAATALDAETPMTGESPFMPLRLACFPQFPEASFLFR